MDKEQELPGLHQHCLSKRPQKYFDRRQKQTAFVVLVLEGLNLSTVTIFVKCMHILTALKPN